MTAPAPPAPVLTVRVPSPFRVPRLADELCYPGAEEDETRFRGVVYGHAARHPDAALLCQKWLPLLPRKSS